jgi:hypothetical protein
MIPLWRVRNAGTRLLGTYLGIACFGSDLNKSLLDRCICFANHPASELEVRCYSVFAKGEVQWFHLLAFDGLDRGISN